MKSEKEEPFFLFCICDGLWSSFLIYDQNSTLSLVSFVCASKSRWKSKVQVHFTGLSKSLV